MSGVTGAIFMAGTPPDDPRTLVLSPSLSSYEGTLVTATIPEPSYTAGGFTPSNWEWQLVGPFIGNGSWSITGNYTSNPTITISYAQIGNQNSCYVRLTCNGVTSDPVQLRYTRIA